MRDPDPQPASSAAEAASPPADLDPRDDDVEGVLGGDALPPRDPASGLPTGQRMHKPGPV